MTPSEAQEKVKERWPSAFADRVGGGQWAIFMTDELGLGVAGRGPTEAAACCDATRSLDDE